LNEPAGLVASPAFHVAGAWMAAWAVRRSRLAFWTLCALNVALTAATVLLGIHYAVDGLAGFALVLASIALYRAPALWHHARAHSGMASRLRNQEPSSASFA
jgi:membrane-associated phospholipid phosphatase